MPSDILPSSHILSILDNPTNDKTPDQTEAEYNEKLEFDRIFDFDESKIILKRILDDWLDEIAKSFRNRKQRDVEVNVEQLREKGRLDEDETMIPVRVIDSNIQREMPAYINYIKNSRRICTFRSLDDPSLDAQQLEIAFTQGMTYIKWETPHYKAIDGAATHGDDCVEVVYDEKYPLNVGIEQIGHDMLYYPRSNKDLQAAPRLIRCYDITIPQLQSWVQKFGFSKEQVDKIIDSRKDTTKANETVRIYKTYCKYQGIVYVSWFEIDSSTRDWLKAPEKLHLEIYNQDGSPKDVTQYPIFMLPYRETEKPRLIDHRGRVYLDEYKQEAQTAILSGYVNKLTRSSNVYASRGQEDGTGSSLKELDLKLTGGRVLSNPVNFFSPDEPSPLTIATLKYFDDSNSQETNQVNFAALNREDSRKTAKEIEAAQGQQSLLNSVQLTMFSTYIREVYSFAWQIVQSQALRNKIKFLQIQTQQPVINPLTQQPIPDPQNPGQPLMQTIWVNNVKVISQIFDIRAAGDVDVIERQQKIQSMKQDWPVIANTGLANEFLAELIRLEYPDTGERWANILLNNPTIQAMQQLIGKMKIQLKGAIQDIPDLAKKLTPQDMQSIQQTLQQADQMAPDKQPGK